MTVYVAMIGLEYEGYASPIGVFSTLSAAKRACLEEEAKSIGRCYYLNVYKFEVDRPSWVCIAVEASKGKACDDR